MKEYMKKFNVDEVGQNKFFVNNGYLVYKNVYSKEFIEESSKYFFSNLKKLVKLSESKKIDYDINGFAAAIIENYSKSNLYDDHVSNKNL